MSAGRILIIDDEREIAAVLGEILEAEGYEAKVASSGWRALDLIPDFRPELLLLDVMMPIISGLELLKKFRALPAHHETPVILMSAAPLRARREDYLWSEFIQKPFNLDYLLQSVKKHLKAAS